MSGLCKSHLCIFQTLSCVRDLLGGREPFNFSRDVAEPRASTFPNGHSVGSVGWDGIGNLMQKCCRTSKRRGISFSPTSAFLQVWDKPEVCRSARRTCAW